jgi:hypothetical protein
MTNASSFASLVYLIDVLRATNLNLTFPAAYYQVSYALGLKDCSSLIYVFTEDLLISY